MNLNEQFLFIITNEGNLNRNEIQSDIQHIIKLFKFFFITMIHTNEFILLQ